MAEFHLAAPVFRVSVLFMLTHTGVTLSRLTGTLEWESAIVNVISNTSSIMTSQWLVWKKKKGPMCSTTRRKSRKINQSALKVSSNTHHSSNNGCFYISGVSRAVEGLLCWMVKAAENTKMKNQVEKQTHFLQPSCLFWAFKTVFFFLFWQWSTPDYKHIVWTWSMRNKCF